MAVFREYGSGLLNEWLDSLSIPRNVENLQQVKEIWKVSNVNCPPLHKWTEVMRNHRSKQERTLRCSANANISTIYLKTAISMRTLFLHDIMNRGQGNCTKSLIPKVSRPLCLNFSLDLSLVSLLNGVHCRNLHFPSYLNRILVSGVLGNVGFKIDFCLERMLLKEY